MKIKNNINKQIMYSNIALGMFIGGLLGMSVGLIIIGFIGGK